MTTASPSVVRPGPRFATVARAFEAAFILAALQAWSRAADMAILIAPLAATCYILAFCPHLPTARPRAVILGHFAAAFCGLAADWLGTFPPLDGQIALTVKLGLALFLSSAAMRLLTAEHPPAAATAVFPIILPLPMEAWLLPWHMAGGAAVTVLISLVWARFRARSVKIFQCR